MKTFFTSLVIGVSLMARAAEFDIRDEAEFKKVVSADAKVEKLGGDMGFLEGPVWNPADGGRNYRASARLGLDDDVREGVGFGGVDVEVGSAVVVGHRFGAALEG